MKKIVFICDLLSQPRIIKRIYSIQQSGIEVKVYGYRRNKYNCNTFPFSIPVYTLGEMEDSKGYAKKLWQTHKDIANVIKENGTKDTIYYAFGFIPALFLYLKKAAYYYEISDLLYGYKKFSSLKNYFIFFEKRIIKHSLTTIMTSMGFKEYLLGTNDESNIIVLPNKLNEHFQIINRNVTSFNIGKRLVFSYVGAIRYKKTVLRFAQIIGEKFPKYEFHFYGESSMAPLCKELAEKYKNVKYFGAFKNPEDLENIYKNIDILVACYETENLNERIAEPNKLYEALFFCKPIIVSENTYLSQQVEKHQCGFAINAYKDQEIITLINSFTDDKLNYISQQELNIPTSNLINNQNDLNLIIKKSTQD